MRLMSCIALAAALLAPAAQAEPFDRMLPESTTVYLSIDNVKRTKERFNTSALKALWDDPAVQAFLEKPLKALEEELARIKKEEGISPLEILSLIDGQFCLVIPEIELRKDGEPRDPDFFILIDVGENAGKVKELIAKIEAGALQEKNLRRVEEEFRGVKIVRYANPDAEEGGKRRGSGPPTWFLDGKTLAISENADALKKLLARRGDTESPSLANNETYRRVRARMGEAPEVFAFLNMRSINKALAELQGEEPAMFRAILGLDTIDALAAQATLGRGGFDFTVFVAMSGAKQGIMKIFDAKNSPLAPPKWVPADATDVMTMAIDFAELLAEARRVEQRLGQAGTIDKFFEMARGSGIDIEKDVLGALGKELTFFQTSPEKPQAAGPIPPVTIAIEVKDKPRLEAALDKVFLMAQGMLPVEEEMYMDTKIRKLNVVMFSVGIALLQDQLLISSAPEQIKDVIRVYGKDAKGFVDSETYARGVAMLPQGRIIIGVQQFAKSLRNGIFGALLLSGGGGAVDANLFPKTEVFEKYLDVAASAMVNEEGGIYYIQRIGFKNDAEEK